MSPESATTYLIRPVRPDEFVALGELTVEAYHGLPDVMDHQAEYDLQLRAVATRAATSCVLVATTPAGELLGGVTYVSGPDDPYSEELSEGEAGMRMLAVAPANQGRGVGRALTNACLDRARVDGRRRLVLHTGSWMPGAIRLYVGMGFSRVPGLDFAPVPGIDLIAYAFEFEAGGVELRPVSADDLAFLAAMTLLAAFPPGYVPEGAAELPRVTRWFEGWGRPNDAGVVAWHGGDRVGAAWCRVQTSVLAWDDDDRALPELAIAVTPDHQARGIGRLLLDGLAQAASAAGHHALSLAVNAKNPALRLYEREGFEVVGVDGDRLTMVKWLGPDRG